MTDVDKLIMRVVADSGATEDEIKSKMNAKKEKTHGLLSDYGAIYAVAKEYGVDLSESETALTPLSDLKPLNSVNVCGRVKTVFGEREFTKKDGSKGHFASVVLVDQSGESRVVLWDQNTKAVSNLHVSDVFMVKNGYVKENRGQIEVHAGPLTNLSINPSNLSVELPEVTETIESIGALEAGLPSVNIVCRVNRYWPKTEFTRGDGSTGSRSSFIAEDETGTIRVVLWDPISETELVEGDILKLENAYTRKGLNDEVELQLGSRSRLTKTDAKMKLKPLEKPQTGPVKITDIKPDMSGFTLEARVLRVYEPREYSKGMMASLIVGDDSDTIRCVLWNEKSQVAAELKEGDAVRIRNAYSRTNLNEEPEVHVGKYSEVAVDSDLPVPSAHDINDMLTEEKKIADLDSSDRYVKIKGKIVDVDDKKLMYMTCSECSKKVQNLGGEWMCEECGIVEAKPNMIASVQVEDDTANIRAVAFRDQAEKLLEMDLEEAMNIVGETQDEKAPLEAAREKVKGSQVTLTGRVNYNDYSEQMEFIVNEVG